MASKQPIERGQRFRDAHPGRFGALGTEWVVDAVFTGRDGRQHAQLICASDMTHQKTRSVEVFNDRSRFQRK